MFFPIRTDSPIKRTPWVNYALIAVNVLIFMASFNFHARPDPRTGLVDPLQGWVRDYMLIGAEPKLYQFLTYQFLHGGTAHIIGNMLFLWVFGNSVNAKMGHPTYLLVYLASGVFAGFGYALFNDGPMLGASGAIAGVTTAYLALFPRSNIEFIYWWIFIGTIELPSMLMILVKMILWDNVIAMNLPEAPGAVGVAYEAHLGGYLFGFVSAVVLLWTRALPRDQFDIVALWRRWYHRQSVASALRDPAARARAELGRVARPISRDSLNVHEAPPDHITDLRVRISAALADRDRVTAAELYQELLQHDAQQVLSREQQLEVGYELYVMGRMPQAAAAFERYVQVYSNAPDADQVRLLLGIILARDLGQFETAQGHLAAVHDKLTDSKRRRQCEEWLSVAREALGAKDKPNGPANSRS